MIALCIDLFCGLGGWADGFLAEGYDVIGFDIERWPYPGQLVLQDVLTLDGSRFKDATIIVASPPCQKYSYMAMPWKRGKKMAAWYREDSERIKGLNALFDACFRIQREAIEAAGHFIPLVVENVRGAQKWVGRSRWNYGSFHLWGDVPALMPMTKAVKVPMPSGMDSLTIGFQQTAKLQMVDGEKGGWLSQANGAPMRRDDAKVPGFRFDGSGKSFQTASVACTGAGHKTTGHANKRDGYGHTRHLTNQAEIDGVKQHKSGRAWFADPDSISGSTSSNSNARKQASATIAKIPFPLALWIAKTFKPHREAYIDCR